MADYGVTDEGFKRKRLDQIKLEKDDAVRGIFGPSIDLSAESPDGQINGSISESQSLLWEIAESSYNAFDPNKATKTTLSNLVQLNGISRFPATFSTTTLTLVGDAGTIIPQGSIVEEPVSKNQFSTDAEITIPIGGSITVEATALLSGVVIAAAGSISKIVTPITGWDSVTNLADAVEGSIEETDEALRTRRDTSFTLAAQNILDAMFAEVANVQGVISLIILENDTNSTDANGIPSHSFEVIVQGGDDTEIATAIYLNKPAGIGSFGSTTIVLKDSQGIDKFIKFQRPTEVSIYITINLTKFSDYPGNGDDLIKQAIVDYAEGRLIQGRGFNVGDDVIYSELYTPINTIPGQQVNSLFIGLSPSPTGTNSIPIDFDEASLFDTANIVVN